MLTKTEQEIIELLESKLGQYFFTLFNIISKQVANTFLNWTWQESLWKKWNVCMGPIFNYLLKKFLLC